MPKKKNSRTPIYFFAKIYANKNRCSIAQAIEKVYLDWKALTPEQKEPYEREYAEWKEEIKNEPKVKIETVLPSTSSNSYQSIGVSRLFQDQQELKEKIRSFNVRTQKWYFIKFETFYQGSDQDGNVEYVLAEVGLIEYSLEEGVTKKYHEFIKPCNIPRAESVTCIENSERTHKIPLYFSKANGDYAQIYRNICEFIKPTEANNYYAPLFSLGTQIEETEKSLLTLRKGDDTKLILDKIIDLQSLMINLAHYAGTDFSLSSVNDAFDSHNYDYSEASQCSYHDEIGNKHCALAYTVRYAYIMAELLCPMFKITLIQGKHVPKISSNIVIYYADDLNNLRKPGKRQCKSDIRSNDLKE